MSCVTPIAAANRYLDQLMKNDAAGFKKSLDPKVTQTHSSLNGIYPVDTKVREGAKAVFEAYNNGLFKATSNVEVRKWSVEVNGMSATCTCVIDQDKNIPNSLQGRYRFIGNCRFDFVADNKSGDLKIKAIYDASEVISLDTPSMTIGKRKRDE